MQRRAVNYPSGRLRRPSRGRKTKAKRTGRKDEADSNLGREQMQESKGEYYLHFVWATQQRTPLLTPELEESVYRCIQAEARRLRCAVLALGGMSDHVHLAVKSPTNLSPAQIMRQIKGVSSKFATDELVKSPDYRLDWFQWQEGYGVFTFSSSQKARVIEYIRCQKQHHVAGSIWPSCEHKA